MRPVRGAGPAYTPPPPPPAESATYVWDPTKIPQDSSGRRRRRIESKNTPDKVVRSTKTREWRGGTRVRWTNLGRRISGSFLARAPGKPHERRFPAGDASAVICPKTLHGGNHGQSQTHRARIRTDRGAAHLRTPPARQTGQRTQGHGAPAGDTHRISGLLLERGPHAGAPALRDGLHTRLPAERVRVLTAAPPRFVEASRPDPRRLAAPEESHRRSFQRQREDRAGLRREADARSFQHKRRRYRLSAGARIQRCANCRPRPAHWGGQPDEPF